MGVVVLVPWLWMQPRGLLHLSPPPPPLNLLHLLPHNSLFPPAHLLLLLQDTPWTLLRPPYPSPNAIGLTLSSLPGELLPHLAQVTEDSVSMGPLQALQGPLLPPILQFVCQHPALNPALWAHIGLATNPLPHPLLWYPLLPDQIPDRPPLVPGSHHLGISSSICMFVVHTQAKCTKNLNFLNLQMWCWLNFSTFSFVSMTHYIKFIAVNFQ